MMPSFRVMPGLILLLASLAPAAAAQLPGPAYATRAALEQQVREQSGDEARMIRARLDSGDFRPGDRVLLIVEGERELSDTFTVGMATELSLPQIPPIPLAGVLRAELPGLLKQTLERYLKAPVVHVRSLIRIAVEGEVGHPGFYALPPETPVMDALTLAGGLTREARLEDARIDREGRVLMSGHVLEVAVRGGRTFDGMNLRAGDRIFVPRRRNWNNAVQTVAILLTIPITVYTLVQIF